MNTRHRLSRITTRSGDDGSTGLADGSRLPKHHERIAVLGDLDELNSQVGVLRAVLSAECPDHAEAVRLDAMLSHVQHDLFDLGGEISLPGEALLKPERVLALDEWLEDLNAQLAPLREFILPAGSMATATAHVVRTVARRAERSLLWLVERETSDARRAALAREAGPQHYLNRLSDLMFVMARSIGRIGGRPEVYWRRESDRPKDNEAGS